MNKKIYLIVSILLIGLSIFILYKKYDKSEKIKDDIGETKKFHQNTQSKWQGKSLIIPEGLLSINEDYTLKQNIETKKNGKPKIFVYFDSGCSDCVTELKEWTEYLKYAQNKYNFDIFFIAKADHLANLKYQVVSQANFLYDVFLDKEEQFIKLNKIPNMKVYQTLLVNKGKVIYIGSPIQGEIFKSDLENKLELLRL